MKSIIAERLVHRGESRIALRFRYDRELNLVLKKVPEAKWSSTHNSWLLPDNKELLKTLPEKFQLKAVIDFSALEQPDKILDKPGETFNKGGKKA